MKRKYTVEDFLALRALARWRARHLPLLTDIICGYPTETEKVLLLRIAHTARAGSLPLQRLFACAPSGPLWSAPKRIDRLPVKACASVSVAFLKKSARPCAVQPCASLVPKFRIKRDSSVRQCLHVQLSFLTS